MNINQLLIEEQYSDTKLRKYIKIPQHSLKEAIDEALVWFITTGKIK